MMSSLPDRNHQFLFSLLDLKSVDSARKVIIRRVYDVCMHSLCLGDVGRARKAFGILLRCKEFDWKASWSLAIYMLNAHDPERDDSFFLSQVEQLRLLMLQDPTLVSYTPPAHVQTRLIP
jgi:RNA polymerase I-specific transcription initiation factor RRN11